MADEEHQEYQYLNLVKKITKDGSRKSDRTGTGTLSVFGTQSRYSLKNGVIPLLTTKRIFWKGVVEELLWFISGSTDSKELTKKGVHIWDKNGSLQFLRSCGFHDREEGDLGPVYGFQWRHSGAPYKGINANYKGQGVDQLMNVLEAIRKNPNDRRMLLCSWNVKDIPQMALPPCHCLVQFYVADGYLFCQLYQRSGDMGLGVPFNIASYALLTHIMAQASGLKPGELIHTIGDAHIYLDHLKPLEEQMKRSPRPFPTLKIKNGEKIEKIEDLKFIDFELDNYNPHPKISMNLSV